MFKKKTFQLLSNLKYRRKDPTSNNAKKKKEKKKKAVCLTRFFFTEVAAIKVQRGKALPDFSNK